MIAFNDDEWGDRGAVVYSVSFLALAVGSVGSLVIALASGLRTRRTITAGR